MTGEYKNKCDMCKKKGEDNFARNYYRLINNKEMWLCKECWNKMLHKEKGA